METTANATCPMADTCRRMMGTPFPGFALMIPGGVLVLLGVVVVIEPRILAWPVAIALIAMGLAMITAAHFMRRVARDVEHMTT